MEDKLVIPLFVLPNGIFPTSEEPLRVFEPRYKQMLDDCILNELPFGYIAAKKPYSEIEGWSAPAEFGVLAQIENFTEQGSNLLFTAKGESRFKIKKIIPPALPAKMFEDVFPSVEELVEAYIDTNPNGKLYLRAEIELIDDLTGEIDEKRWKDFIISWSRYIIKVDFILKMSGLSEEDLLLILYNEFIPYDNTGLWNACLSILESHEEKQNALSSENAEEVMKLLEESLNQKFYKNNDFEMIIDEEE
ncbi:MAG: hypothetical protein CL983_04130 [Euryarchaeota archaeon]|nr:hypothetical protein [Euryarchaeota archaeon]